MNSMNDEILLKMSDGCQCNVTLVFTDGRELKGFIDNYESRYDNDGEASICFATEDGDLILVEEHELADIIIDEE